MNEVLKLMDERCSLRSFADRDIEEDKLDAILHAAMRAPTAGNQMLYSILLIRDKATKEVLSHTCDDQPFIAQAPVALVFLADHQKWFDYYAQNGVGDYCKAHGLRFEAPQESDLLLAIEDAMCAAQNAVIAAESLGIGSCYIGDIVENYEIHKKLFDLPDWVFPIAMLVLGYPKETHKKVKRTRFDREYVVFNEKYRHLTDDDRNHMFRDQIASFQPLPNNDAANHAQRFYTRKTGADFSREMARSVRVALKRWDGRDLGE